MQPDYFLCNLNKNCVIQFGYLLKNSTIYHTYKNFTTWKFGAYSLVVNQIWPKF